MPNYEITEVQGVLNPIWFGLRHRFSLTKLYPPYSTDPSLIARPSTLHPPHYPLAHHPRPYRAPPTTHRTVLNRTALHRTTFPAPPSPHLPPPHHPPHTAPPSTTPSFTHRTTLFLNSPSSSSSLVPTSPQ